LVHFSGESKALRVNDDFLSAFSQDFLNEVKHLKSGGFVDIPVGDFTSETNDDETYKDGCCKSD
jgi:uridine kinase